MLEVTKIEFEGMSFLKCRLKKLNAELVGIVTSIEGWFKAREHLTYGLPYEKLEELNRKTYNHMVVWKLEDDSMGALVKGIDTTDVPETYIVPYRPKTELRGYQIQSFNLLMQRDSLLIADQEGVGKTPPILSSHEAKIQNGVMEWGLFITKAGLVYDVYNQAKKFTDLKVKVVSGTPKHRHNTYHEVEKGECELLVVSYEMFRHDFDNIIAVHKARPFGVVYCDEMH